MNNKKETPYYLPVGGVDLGDDILKKLGATELAILRGFVRDVLNTIEYDDTGVTDDLYDQAMNCAEILDIVVAPPLDEFEFPEEELRAIEDLEDEDE